MQIKVHDGKNKKKKQKKNIRAVGWVVTFMAQGPKKDLLCLIKNIKKDMSKR